MPTRDQLLVALEKAGARAREGDTRARAAAQRMAQMLKNQEYEEESTWYETGLQALGSGATFGLADELGAGVRTVIDPIVKSIIARGDERVTGISGLGDYFKTMGERYDKTLAEQREAVETAKREDPYQFMAGELVGGLAQGAIGTVGRMGKAAGLPALQQSRQIGQRAKEIGQKLTTMQGIKESMKTSAAAGALAGYGESENDALRELMRSGISAKTLDTALGAISDATQGGVMGATVGAALPGGAALFRKGMRSVKNAFTPRARLTEEGKDSIRQALQKDIESGWITSEEEAIEALKRTPGMDAGDLGPHLQRLLKDISQSGTAAGTQVKQDLLTRNRDQWSRILPQMNRIIGTDKGYHKTLSEMRKVTEDEAGKAYDRAYQKTIRITPEIQRFLNSKSGKKSLKRANEIREENDMPPITPESLLLGQQRSMRDMDDVLRAMDDHVTDGFRGKRGSYDLGMARKRKRDAFRDNLYRQNEDFRDARQTYGTLKSREEMMERGNQIFREDVDMIKEEFDAMPEADRKLYVIGMIGAMQRQMKFKPDDADIMKGLFNIQGRREIIESVMGDTNRFEDLMKFVRNEEKMFDSYKKIVPVTETAENLMREQTDQAARMAGMFAFGTTRSLLAAGMASRAARLMGRDVGISPYQQELREQQRQMLMGGVEGLERAMQQPGGLLSPGAQPIPGAAASGLMATGILETPEEYGGI